MAMRNLLLIFLAGGMLASCASFHRNPVEEPAKTTLDRTLARLIGTGKFEEAMRASDSLLASKDPTDQEIASYWKAVGWIYQDQPDSALAILDAYHGNWSGGLRRVHSEAFVRLAREASRDRTAARRLLEEQQPKAATEKSMQERVDALQKETGDLRAEIGRLETERLKYQKLINDLESIR